MLWLKEIKERYSNAYLQNNSPCSTTSTMFRRPSVTPISGNKTPRKELSLLTKGVTKVKYQDKLD